MKKKRANTQLAGVLALLLSPLAMLHAHCASGEKPEERMV